MKLGEHIGGYLAEKCGPNCDICDSDTKIMEICTKRSNGTAGWYKPC